MEICLINLNLCFRIWLQVLDRRQQRLELMVLSIDNFIEHASSSIINSSHNSTFVPPQVIYSQTSNVWVNVRNNIYYSRSIIFKHKILNS